jgi:hypothetical protein
MRKTGFQFQKNAKKPTFSGNKKCASLKKMNIFLEKKRK